MTIGWENASASALESLMDSGSARQTILVIEDDPAIADILQILLEDSGCEILRAHSGREALDLARETRPALITLDLMLPDMDGREILRQLEGDADLAAIPVIVVSARPYDPGPERNVVGALLKPFDATELDKLVRRALQGQVSEGL
jgi:adenylate cyclase